MKEVCCRWEAATHVKHDPEKRSMRDVLKTPDGLVNIGVFQLNKKMIYWVIDEIFFQNYFITTAQVFYEFYFEALYHFDENRKEFSI